MIKTLNIEENEQKKELVYVLIATIILDFFAYIGLSQYFLFLYIFFCCIGLCFSAFTPLYIKIALLSAMEFVECSNAFTLIIWALTIGPIIFKSLVSKKGKIEGEKVFLFGISAFVFLLSCSFGIGSSYTSFVMQCLYVLAFLCAASINKPNQLRMAMYAFILSGAFVCLVVFTELINETAHWIGYGYRLTYHGNERDLANAMTIPSYYFAYKLLGNVQYDGLVKNNTQKKGKLFSIFCLLPFVVLLFLSYSRGNYIALLIPVLFIIFSGNKQNKIKIAIFLIIMIIGVYLIIGKLGVKIRYDEMLNYHGSINVRFDIWKYYFSRLFDNPIRFLFGFGPGDLKRISAGTLYANFYAHSAFFDYLFSFGFTGFAIIAYMAIKSFVIPRRNKDVYLMGFSLLTLLMFLPYGSSASFELHIMLGLAAGSIAKNTIGGKYNVS